MGNTQLFSLKSNNISFYCIVHLTCKYEIIWLFREEKTTYVSVIVSELLNGKMYPGVWSCKGPGGKGVVFWCSLHLPTHMFTLKSR